MSTKEKTIESDWEVKDRSYLLIGASPLTWTIQTKHTRKKPLLYYDEEAGYNREIRYATNQRSIFVDEQDGYSTLGHVVFEDGALYVPKTNQPLQKLLSIYHPQAEKQWRELKPEAATISAVEKAELTLDALNLVSELKEEELIGILRTEHGSAVTRWSPSQIKRMGFSLANSNPKLFIDLAKDEDVQLRNFANLATELGVVKLANNNTQFVWAKNGAKIFTIPFDENPYVAFAQFFKTDAGADVYKSIEKKLK